MTQNDVVDAAREAYSAAAEKYKAELATLRAQRDELLAACEAYVATDSELGGTTSRAEAHNARLNLARAAIAKAKG